MIQVRYRRDLWKLIEEARISGDGAEIGVAEGLFSRDMLNWTRAFTAKGPTHFLNRLYMVDRWASCPSQKGDASNAQVWHDANLSNARELTKPFGDRAIFLQGDSKEMALQVPDKSLALLYIDADHSYQGCLKDLLAWTPKVMKNGFVALHDYEAPQYGVKQAVTEFCHGRYLVNLLPEDALQDAGAFFQV